MKNDDDDTSLPLAAARECADMVKNQNNAGSDINCSGGSDNCTLAYYRSIWPEVVKALANRDADIQVKEYTPLLLAAAEERKDIVANLIEEGADINYSGGPDNCTVLHYAASNGWLDIVKSLLNKGADIQVKNNNGFSPLLTAAFSKHPDICKLLINAGADVNYSCVNPFGHDCWAALHYASKYGWLEIVQCLLNKGADIQRKTGFGSSPLLLAAEWKHADVVEYLINLGADIHFSDAEYGSTVLHYASQNGWSGIVMSLLKKGADIEAQEKYGLTPLGSALYCKQIETAEHLINAGADVNVKPDDSDPYISRVIKILPDNNLLRLLINKGAYLNYSDYQSLQFKSSLEDIFKDIELCSQAIINEFNYKDLPKLYKLSMSCKVLPSIEKLRIVNNSQIAHEVLQSVKRDIQENGHCRVLYVRPIVLKMLALKSILIHCDNIKTQNDASNQSKRSVEFDSGIKK